MKLTVDGIEMSFAYDAEGKPFSIYYDESVFYYYITNLQGDVVAIVDKDGDKIVSYTYDAWGNLLSTTGSKASTVGKYNPLRYRGYVYDRETKLYYLSTRYYNPEWGRFINADNYPTTGQGLTGNNMFAYCGNRPTVCFDPSGEFSLEALAFAALGAAVNVATSFLVSKAMGQTYTWKDAGIAAASGALSTFGGGWQVAGGILSGGYSAVTTYENGANGVQSVTAGMVSFFATYAGIGNFSGLGKAWSNMGTQAFIDVVFGTGSNAVSSASNLLLTPKEAQKKQLITIEPAPATKETNRVIGPNIYTVPS